MPTLHIIGNGFDLYHGIKSSYGDFHDYAWSHSKDKSYWLGLLESCYPQKYSNGKLELWCDLEHALAKPDFQSAFEATTDDISPVEDHELRYQAQMEDAPETMMVQMFDAFHEIFEEWVSNIDIDVKAKNIPNFDRNGRFLSFNYTETLEHVYGISRNKINYIHGRRGTADTLNVGHASILEGNDYLSDNPEIYEYAAYDNIAKVVNDQRKDTNDVILANSKNWKSLSDIDKVVVYGHSLSDIDYPYFMEIAKHVSPNAEWFFSIYYNDATSKKKSEANVQANVAKLGLISNHCHTFKM